MAGITNLAKGAAKNIAQALSTDGVGKALAKRAAVGAGIGAVGGGTLSAIQGGSFGEGAVRGGFIGAGIGAASGAYTMGAFGSNALDEAGRFRKGATSVYSHVASGNATWAQVNQYRQQDINAFMGHIRDAQDGKDLVNRFTQMDGAAKTSHGTNPEQLKWDLENGTIVGGSPAKEVADNITKDAAAKVGHSEAASNAVQHIKNNNDIQKRIDIITGVNRDTSVLEDMKTYYEAQSANAYNLHSKINNLSNITKDDIKAVRDQLKDYQHYKYGDDKITQGILKDLSRAKSKYRRGNRKSKKR